MPNRQEVEVEFTFPYTDPKTGNTYTQLERATFDDVTARNLIRAGRARRPRVAAPAPAAGQDAAAGGDAPQPDPPPAPHPGPTPAPRPDPTPAPKPGPTPRKKG
ncbi:hypothetical protein [Cellulosimicrobium funkei]|uniref:hypothetical protein n=1 Tax=Cellulosimicrobium funkei TaxID=264251 RepID=UPI0034326511